eukprot:jgi/Tetstr1/425074/TSEL_015538.t1
MGDLLAGGGTSALTRTCRSENAEISSLKLKLSQLASAQEDADALRAKVSALRDRCQQWRGTGAADKERDAVARRAAEGELTKLRADLAKAENHAAELHAALARTARRQSLAAIKQGEGVVAELEKLRSKLRQMQEATATASASSWRRSWSGSGTRLPMSVRMNAAGSGSLSPCSKLRKQRHSSCPRQLAAKDREADALRTSLEKQITELRTQFTSLRELHEREASPSSGCALHRRD